MAGAKCKENEEPALQIVRRWSTERSPLASAAAGRVRRARLHHLDLAQI